MKTKDEILNTLGDFTGTESYHRLYTNLLLTDGALYLAESCGAFWLMDVIWSYLGGLPQDEHFLVVTLEVVDTSGVFKLADDIPAQNYSVTQEISYTNFPLDTITLYVSRMDTYWVVMLTSEY
jgi:hypothetical protein